MALGDRRDPHHQTVQRTLEDEPGLLIVPAPVSAEADYLLRERSGPHAARRFLADIAAGLYQVEGLTREEHQLALVIHDRYADLDLGLADIAVVILANRFHTTRLLTFDGRHFRAVTPLRGGRFTLLPADHF